MTLPEQKAASEDLAALVARACDGAEDAWRELIERYSRRVYALVRSRGGRDDIAQEVTQSVFVTMAEHFSAGRYQERGRFESWLFRVAMNRLRDEQRRSRRAPTTSDDALASLAAAPTAVSSADSAQIAQLRESLARLNDADREIISLRHHAGLEFRVIADLLGKPVGTVLARHHRALAKLRTMLDASEREKELRP